MARDRQELAGIHEDAVAIFRNVLPEVEQVDEVGLMNAIEPALVEQGAEAADRLGGGDDPPLGKVDVGVGIGSPEVDDVASRTKRMPVCWWIVSF